MKRILAFAATALLLVIGACTILDTTDPNVTIVYPADGADLDTGAVTIKAVATDNEGVTKVEFYAGTTLLGSDATGTADTFDVSWTATAGSYKLKAVASDAANNTDVDEVDVTVTAGGGGPTEHHGDITADETWYPSGNPHILTGNVSVHGNATLTIKPGCIIKLDPDVELYAGYGSAGSIVAEGTADSVITFTSNVASPSPGDWISVSVWDLGMNTASFKHCVFEYGGGNSQGEVYCRNRGVKFSNNVVRQSGGYGIQLQNVGFKSCDSNTVTQCATYPLCIEAEYIKSIGSGNAFTGNTTNAVYVDNGAVTEGGTWPNPGVPYVISTNLSISDNSNSPVITVTPGTVFKMFPDVEFYVGYGNSGGLIADGTAGQIVFTSNVSSPSPGDWQSLSFYDNTISNQTKLINCKVEYAGQGSNGANVYFRNCTPTVTGDSIGHSLHYGIALWGTQHPDSAALEANNTFYDCPDGHVYHP